MHLWTCPYVYIKKSNAFRKLLLHCRVKGTNANSKQTSQLREFLWHPILIIPPTAMNVIWHQLQTVHIAWNPMDPTLHPTQQRTALLHTQVLHTQHDAKKKQELIRSEIFMEDSINITVFWDVTPCILVVFCPTYGGSRYLQNVHSFFWTTGNGVTSHKTAVLKEETIYSVTSIENTVKPLFLKFPLFASHEILHTCCKVPAQFPYKQYSILTDFTFPQPFIFPRINT